MNTLLHICCAPCANQCIDVLRTDGCAVTGYWYNPNIHPFTEYRSRRNCLRDYAASIELPLIERNDYGLRPFVRAVAEDIDGRCVKCYSMRLYAAAHEAKEGGFDSFTSSLFISPYQNHELLREVAERAAAEYGVTFLYRDFRPLFRAGQERARELGMYIQKYCGCVFSGTPAEFFQAAGSRFAPTTVTLLAGHSFDSTSQKASQFFPNPSEKTNAVWIRPQKSSHPPTPVRSTVTCSGHVLSFSMW